MSTTLIKPSKNVKWEIVIILPEFKANLDKLTIIEVSLLSKLIRCKLESKIFNNIKFNAIHFARYINNSQNLIWGYFYDRYGHFTHSDYTEIFDKSNYKEFKIEPAIKELESVLNEFKSLVKSCYFVNIEKSGYYIFPMFNIFHNLITLKLYKNAIPFSKFNQLTNNLVMLENIELNNCSFIKLLTEESKPEDIKFPLALKKLTIHQCNLASVESLSSPYDYLFESDVIQTITDFNLPPSTIPSLISLDFFTGDYKDNGLNNFLINNHQLECLNLNLTIIDQFKVNYFKNLKKLILKDFYFDEDILLIDIISIKELEFHKVTSELFPFIQKLGLMSINLNRLTFIIDTNEESTTRIINLLNNIVSDSNQLKSLNLFIVGDLKEDIKLNNLNNVELLEIRSNLDILTKIEFFGSKSLNRVKLYNPNYILKSDAIKNKFFGNNNNWKFKFYGDCIKGYKIK